MYIIMARFWPGSYSTDKLCLVAVIALLMSISASTYWSPAYTPQQQTDNSELEVQDVSL